MEGRTAGHRRAVELARKNIPTCGPDELLAEVKARVRGNGHDTCVVVNDQSVVLGRLRGKAWERDPDARAEDVMSLGPATVRPDVFVNEYVDRLRKSPAKQVLVTDYGSHEDGGRLLGVLYPEDVERELAINSSLSAGDR